MMCLHLDVVLSYYDACSLNVLIAFQKYQSCSLALTILVCEFRFLVTQILAPYLEVETARLEFYLPKHIVQREMQTCENSTSLPHVSLLCISCEKSLPTIRGQYHELRAWPRRAQLPAVGSGVWMATINQGPAILQKTP